MFPLLQKLFDPQGFLPLGECFSWQQDVLITNVVGDSVIALIYFSVPFILFILSKRRAFFIHKYIFVVFTLFIWVCAFRHVLNIITVWEPVYYLQGVFKLITSFLAVITVTVFYRSYPKALGLDKANALAKANDRLLEEIAERERAQVALRQANEALESRVQQRTSQLIKTNRELEKEIEQRKKTEEDLLEKNKELTRINSELDNFVYHASHDLKDPIVKIEGLVTALKEEIPEVTPSVNEIFQHLDGSLLKVDKTVLDLTEVGRIQKSEEPETFEEVRFEEVCEQVKLELGNQLNQANATIETNFEKAPSIYFSPQNLKRICSNLMLNALHMRNPEKPLRLTISTEPASDYIMVRISDNSLNLNPPGKQIASVPLPQSARLPEEGFGLSLYIVQRILNNCQGQLKIQSAPGAGSTFEVFLPAKVLQAGNHPSS